MHTTSFYSSVDPETIAWDYAHVWLEEEKGREIVEILGDGLCFVRSLQHTLGIIYGEKYSIATMKQKIMQEIRRKAVFYQQFLEHCTDPDDVVHEMQTFFNTQFFATEIVDLLVGVCINV
ncbi:MAG: hypothetical protein MJE68_08425, partial [Proteobacteria bacterium]|nr:hypothetical protein [Pseudomonadota bacterium]